MTQNVALVTSLLEQIRNDIESIKSKDKTVLTVSYLKACQKDLDINYKHAKALHSNILVSRTTDKIAAYHSEKVFDNLRENYYTYWSIIDDLIPKDVKQESEGSLNTSIHTSSCTHKNELKLPVIKIPIFSGKYKEWRKFHNLFRSLVHENQALNNIQRFSYLQSSVTEEADELIGHLELEEQNYTEAWTILKERYEHKRMLTYTELNSLFNQPPVKSDCSSSLKVLLDTTNECLIALKQLGEPIQQWNSILIFILEDKLPKDIKVQWQKSISNSTDIPTYEEFKKFLFSHFRMLEMVELPDSLQTKTFHTQSSETSFNKNKIQCPICKDTHYFSKCPTFRKAKPPARLDLCKKHKICTNCLAISHTIDKCTNTKTCYHCSMRHNSLLHRHPNSNKNSNKSKSDNTTPPAIPQTDNTPNQNQINPPNPIINHNFHTQRYSCDTVFATAIVSVINKRGDSIEVRALIDPCSQDSYIAESVVQTLNLTKYYAPSSVVAIGGTPAGECLYRTNFKIKSIHNEFELLTSAAVRISITNPMPTKQLRNASWNHLHGLKLADPRYFEPGNIQMLLGIMEYQAIVQNGLIKGSDDQPFAQKTSLGWVIQGKTSSPSRSNEHHISLSMLTEIVSYVDLEKQMVKFWELEQPKVEIPTNPEELKCENIFKSSIKRCSDGHYMVALPFKNETNPILGDSKKIALRRFYNLELRLEKNPSLKKDYHNTIKEYLESGHMIPCPTTNTQNTPQNKECFLPHHAVLKSSSSTTKLRVVFDASCKTSDGTSLNDHLLIGPKLQKDIREVILNWRKYPFSLSADIARMYRQFWINPEHYCYQKIFWRFSPSDSIKEYFLTTVTFGTGPAPYLALRALQYIASTPNAISNYPLGTEACKNDFYVDDLLTGAYTLQDAIDKQNQTQQLLQESGLTLRKWCSNSAEVLAKIPSQLRSSSEVTFDESEFQKMLGIFWSPKQDVFSFKISENIQNTTKHTKRQILSMIARLYDPMGYISPCIMYAKLIMKSLWLSKKGWDEEVDPDIKNKFVIFLNQLPNLEHIRIPRWIKTKDDISPISLFGFCDASLKGYGAVVYLLNPDQKSKSSERLILLTSKTRVAPTSFVSLARLELCGAVLLADLLHWCRNLFKQETLIHAYTDSQIVLSWINSHPSRWKTFIANRTSQILEYTKPEQWKYVRSEMNPADVASKGILPDAMASFSLWWNGPNLDQLGHSQTLLLSHEENELVELERNKNSICMLSKPQENIFINQYSSFLTLCRKLKLYCKFFIAIYGKLLRKYPKRKQEFLQRIQNLSNSENVALRLVQKSTYFHEIDALAKNMSISRKSNLLSLNPFIDGFGLLRVGGRLDNSSLSYSEKHPLILPPYHQVTQNIVRGAHLLTIHGTNKTVGAYIRLKYHIVRAQEVIRKLTHKCITCVRYRRKLQTQLMGSLPYPRVNEFRPFLNSGIDFAGPISLKAWKGRCNKVTKGYIAVFVCLSTKALHLEVVSELSSNAFLACFKRFVGRRGHCQNLYSDCGTNFVGAAKILEDEVIKAQRQWKSDLQPQFEEFATKWHFIPPASPHFGGLWEAGVKSVKTHLIKAVGNSSLTYEELSTLLIQIEAILNSRPLCPITDDPESYTALTPGHFLIGSALVAPPQPGINVESKHPLTRWQYIQKLRQCFWNEWREEYLHRLQSRPKWKQEESSIQTNDLVLIMDERFPPTQWPLARVINLHPSKTDKLPRVVTLKTAGNKIFQRPITKLRLLPVRNLNESDRSKEN